MIWGAHARTSHPLHTLEHPNPAISARFAPMICALSGPVGLEAIFRFSAFWPSGFVGLGSLDPNTFGYPSGTPLAPIFDSYRPHFFAIGSTGFPVGGMSARLVKPLEMKE
jgi:hypothetical protein